MDLVSCLEEFGGCSDCSEGVVWNDHKQGNSLSLVSLWRMDEKEEFCDRVGEVGRVTPITTLVWGGCVCVKSRVESGLFRNARG